MIHGMVNEIAHQGMTARLGPQHLQKMTGNPPELECKHMSRKEHPANSPQLAQLTAPKIMLSSGPCVVVLVMPVGLKSLPWEKR